MVYKEVLTMQVHGQLTGTFFFNIKICHDLHVGHHNILYIYNAGPKAVVLLWFYVACFWCQSFGDVSPYVCSYYFSSVSVAEWPPFLK